MNLRRVLNVWLGSLPALLLVSTGLALEITPANPVPPYRLVKVKPSEKQGVIVFSAGLVPVETVRAVDGSYVFTAPPGRYSVLGLTMVEDVPTFEQSIVEIARPGPGPDPDPDPGPLPVPFPTDRLTTIILRESHLTGRLPPAQAVIFSDPKVLKWFANYSEVRIVDPDVTDAQMVNVPPVVRQAIRSTINLAAGKYPYIAISDGTRGHYGELPANSADLLSLLNQFK